MKTTDKNEGCQIANLPHFSEGYAVVPPENLARRVRLLVRRNLNAYQVKKIRAFLNRFIHAFQKIIHPDSGKAAVKPAAVEGRLQVGDWVRVRSSEEIKGTLNPWGQLKGCMFMPDMAQYCGTTQRIFRRLERFVDERDYHVKESHGVVLLEGLYCQGTAEYGRCDRACFYFWREEWLEKIDLKDKNV